MRSATLTSAGVAAASSSSDREIAESADRVSAESADCAAQQQQEEQEQQQQQQLQRFSPNPAGAASAACVQGSHTRHTTCSSVESEGFHSSTSGHDDRGTNLDEVLTQQDFSQDFSQWSKQVSWVVLKK